MPFTIELEADYVTFGDQLLTLFMDAQAVLETTALSTGSGSGQPYGIRTRSANNTFSQITSTTTARSAWWTCTTPSRPCRRATAWLQLARECSHRERHPAGWRRPPRPALRRRLRLRIFTHARQRRRRADAAPRAQVLRVVRVRGPAHQLHRDGGLIDRHRPASRTSFLTG